MSPPWHVSAAVVARAPATVKRPAAPNRRLERVAPAHAFTQCSTGCNRNSSTGIPSPPTSSVRSGLNAAANAASPGCASRRAAALHLDRRDEPPGVGRRSPPPGCGHASRRARTRRPPRRSPGARPPPTRPAGPRTRGPRAPHPSVRPDWAVIERGVEHLQLGARAALARRLARVLRQPGEHPGAAQQIQVVRERRRVPRVLELAEHLGVGQHLAGVAAAELEQAPQECRLVHAREQQHVARDRGLDQRIEDVARPAVAVRRRAARLPDSRRR